MSKAIAINPAFIESLHGRIFVSEFLPDADRDRGHVVVFVPPFAEEMNRSRRMLAVQARALAASGVRSVVFDLPCTGDSEGDFGAARWDMWCDSVATVVEWSTAQQDDSFSLIATRLGAMLAFDAGRGVVGDASRIVLWQPCTSGKSFLRQFLRLRLASQLSANQADRETVGQLMDRFAAGEATEVAGYEVAAELAVAIEAAVLTVPPGVGNVPIDWFEIVAATDAPVPVAARNAADRIAADQATVNMRTVTGDRFWDTVETTVAPQLVIATTALFT